MIYNNNKITPLIAPIPENNPPCSERKKKHLKNQ